MQHLVSDIADTVEGDSPHPFQAYYCPECDEVRWCQPGQPACFSDTLEDDHAGVLMPVWVER